MSIFMKFLKFKFKLRALITCIINEKIRPCNIYYLFFNKKFNRFFLHASFFKVIYIYMIVEEIIIYLFKKLHIYIYTDKQLINFNKLDRNHASKA
jgi:hypothetical protein